MCHISNSLSFCKNLGRFTFLWLWKILHRNQHCVLIMTAIEDFKTASQALVIQVM